MKFSELIIIMYHYICFLPISSRSVGVADIVGMYTVLPLGLPKLLLGLPILLLGLPILLLGLQPSMFTTYEWFIPKLMRLTLN